MSDYEFSMHIINDIPSYKYELIRHDYLDSLNDQMSQINLTDIDPKIVFEKIELLSQGSGNYIFKNLFSRLIILCLEYDKIDYVLKNKHLIDYEETGIMIRHIHDDDNKNPINYSLSIARIKKIISNLGKVLSLEEMIKFRHSCDTYDGEFYDNFHRIIDREIEKKVFQETSYSKKFPEELSESITSYLFGKFSKKKLSKRKLSKRKLSKKKTFEKIF